VACRSHPTSLSVRRPCLRWLLHRCCVVQLNAQLRRNQVRYLHELQCTCNSPRLSRFIPKFTAGSLAHRPTSHPSSSGSKSHGSTTTDHRVSPRLRTSCCSVSHATHSDHSVNVELLTILCSLLVAELPKTSHSHLPYYLTWYQYLNFSISDRFRLLLWLPNRTRPTLGVFDLNPDSQTSLLMRIFRNKSNAPSPKT
jgi:hypothetical protein